ncbi:MAG: hypothetical protein HY291_13750, partial [Planctomycetes bacterium]|nr:hypothetical protein [Planctomycetota bacterium]
MPDTLTATWRTLCDSLQTSISPESFKTWFNRLAIANWEHGVLQLST